MKGEGEYKDTWLHGETLLLEFGGVLLFDSEPLSVIDELNLGGVMAVIDLDEVLPLVELGQYQVVLVVQNQERCEFTVRADFQGNILRENFEVLFLLEGISLLEA